MYLGKLARNKSTSTAYKLDFSGLGAIDAGKGIGKNQCFYLGAHFANDIAHEGYISDKRKKYNAKFDGVCLKATKIIHSHTEIFVDYNGDRC